MGLILVYIVFVLLGDLVAFGAGYIAHSWSEAASLPTFLTLFFLSFYVAWKISVRVTEGWA